jgi:hypothetical protein
MSRKSRALKNARLVVAEGAPSVSKVRGPADVAVMVPYLLGFQPIESLVLVALEGPRKRFGPVLRVDLVDDPCLQAEQAALVVGVMTTNEVALVLVAAFSDDAGRADPLVRLVLDGLAQHGVGLEDAFRADGRRWWSYVCHDASCCSPDGVPYDAATSRVAAEAVLSGLSFVPDRESLRARFARDDPGTRTQVECSVASLRRDPSTHPRAASAHLESRVASVLGAPSALTPAETAWLALAVQSPAGQECALRLIDRANAEDHFEMWRIVMCRVADELLPPVGCLTAFSAWLDGRGVLASHAVDQVLEVAPGHPFARVIADLLAEAVNPRTWSDQLLRRDHDRSPPRAG